MTTPVPICVAGAGSIGMRHVEVAQSSDHVSLDAVIEPDAARRAALQQAGLPAFASLEDAPRHLKAAIIASPTPSHASDARTALTRGMGVMVEKPLTATLGEARALQAEAERLDLPLFTGHHRRCHPFSLAARTALRDLGDLVGLQGFWSLRKHLSYYDVAWRRKPGAGPLMSNLSHEIDLLRFFVGEIREVSALTSSARRGFEIEDSAALALRFDSGALGSFLISDAGASPWAFEAASYENPAIAGSGEDYLRVTGTEGALGFPSLTRWTGTEGLETEWSRPLTRIAAQRFDRIDPLLAQIDRFAGVLQGGEDDVLCTGADGAAALGWTLATALSARHARPMTLDEVPPGFRGV